MPRRISRFADAGMLDAVTFFGPLGVIKAVQSANKISCDAAYALKLDALADQDFVIN